MRYIFSGLSYTTEGGQFILDNIGTHGRRTVALLDCPITLRRMSARFCSGWYDLSSFTPHPCPTSSQLTANGNSCEACVKKTGYSPFFYNVPAAQISQQQRNYNASPHSVYLASFGPDLIKVGISNSGRLNDRWLDQGAIYAREIFNCADAASARELEAFVSSSASIVEQVSVALKARSLVRYGVVYDPEPSFERVLNLISASAVLGDRAGLTVDLTTYYKPERIPFSALIDVSRESPLEVSGRICFSVGGICIFETDGLYYLCDMSRFKSHVVHFDSVMRPRQNLTLF
ncbi:DUF2797 domain-containing protein [Pseudomonas agarici]|uniref:DUF2797 domain-containing protein n=1 Tax=Pseudomonas agarici TaxID=46677 RepID=UPI0008D0AC2A|nr:DUF2797 domain-containing protein [Pseudomonas agarici]SEL70705.1 Protein of unknown function [Pseudomonas agarici]